MQTYSDFFKTLHDETSPTGYLGDGAHYSILRAVVFHDQMGKSLPEGQFANFAVIWDEDHDVRVVEPIEEIYRRGLLSSFLAFGERKGHFTAVLSNEIPFVVKATPFDHLDPGLLVSVDEIEFSVRTSRCLAEENIVLVADLVQKTEGELLRIATFGRQSLNEVKERLSYMELRLGMEVPGWPPESNEDIVKPHERVSILKTAINAICQSLNDPWRSDVVALEGMENAIISDKREKVSLYLRNLEMLWRLGIAPSEPQKKAA